MKSNQIESEANLFALFLLMPADLLVKEIETTKLDWTDNKSIQQICKKFDVSVTALTVRMNYLSKSQKKRIGLI
jgi:Zn-dependent peptidase ImmA (M78 family)